MPELTDEQKEIVRAFEAKHVPYDYKYALRLQALDGYQAKFTKVFGDRFEVALCVPHKGKKGDNPHYHFILRCDYKNTTQALRKYLNSHFDQGKGNKHLSLKPWDGSAKACAYLFHEGTEALMEKGVLPEEIETFKAMNHRVKEMMVKSNDVVDEAVALLLQKYKPDKRQMFHTLFDIYVAKGEWLPNKFQWERLMNKVRLEYARAKGGAHIHQLRNEMFNEIFPYG